METLKADFVDVFNAIQETLIIDIADEYKSLVSSKISNRDLPVHNWYRFKEGYHPSLVIDKLERMGISGSGINIVDPFVGSGNTVLAAQWNNLSLESGIKFNKITGIETNPFIYFLANTKINWIYYKRESLNNDFMLMKERITITDLTRLPGHVPQLSTLTEYRAYNESTLYKMINLLQFIDENSSGLNNEFFRLVYAAIIEPVSSLKKTGRALKRMKELGDEDVWKYFEGKAIEMIEGLPSFPECQCGDLPEINLINGDVRTVSLERSEYHLAFFSPPYLNHFDYTEVYKMELWMLGFVNDRFGFKEQRYKTFRSHPSVKFPETSHAITLGRSEFIGRILQSLNNFVSRGNEEPFVNSIRGYIDDCYITLSKLKDALKIDGLAVCVVANSVFGSKEKGIVPVATDLIIAEIARDLGFEIQHIEVARELHRRGIQAPFLRESLVVFKKIREDFE